MSLFLKYLTVLGMAALPVLELRGAVPYGVAMDLPLPAVLAVSILGNMLPVPFIILFIRRIFDWMKTKSRRLCSIAEKLEAAQVRVIPFSNYRQVKKYLSSQVVKSFPAPDRKGTIMN